MDKPEDHKNLKKVIKLDDLSRENIHKVPEGYFDELPGIIQTRISQEAKKGWQVYLTPANGWKVSLAMAVIALVLVFSGVFNSDKYGNSVEELLAEVSLEDLIEYVEYSEISTDEILAELDLSEYDMDFIMGEDIRLLDEGEFEDLDMLELYEVYGIEEELF